MDNDFYDDFYDIAIDIEKFEDLKNNGWKIVTSEEGLQKYEYFKNVSHNNDIYEREKKKLNRIGILGGGNVGKTFILHKLLGKQYNDKIKTRGISVIYPEIEEKDKLFVCLDTCNTLNTSLFVKNLSNEEVFNLSDKERSNYLKDLIKNQKFRNIFIEDFISEKSNILIIVFNQLSFKEQKFLNRLKMSWCYDKLFVIHNLQFFGNKEIIEDYIENTIKKSMFSNLEKGYIINLESNSNDKAYYYLEKEFGCINNNKNSYHAIYHLFMAKEGSDAGKFFNDKTIDFIRSQILSQIKTKTFDVLEEIKEFLSFNSLIYMIKEENKERPIDIDEIEIKTEHEVTYLQCKNKNYQLKDCVIDGMGTPNVTAENSINPSFICYKGTYENKKRNEKWPALIVKTEMFADTRNIKIKPILSEDYETMNIIISCEKKFENDPNIIEEFEGGDIKEGDMRINIQFKLKDFELDEKKRPQVREPFPGIKLIYFKLEDKNNKNEEIITEIISEKKNSKSKKKK